MRKVKFARFHTSVHVPLLGELANKLSTNLTENTKTFHSVDMEYDGATLNIAIRMKPGALPIEFGLPAATVSLVVYGAEEPAKAVKKAA